MKITTNINAANTNLSSAKKTTAPKGKLNVLGDKDSSVSKNEQSAFETPTTVNADKAELVRNLSSLSKEEKADAAYYSYMDMQICCKSAVDSLEVKRYCFSSLKEQKAYYTDLLEKGGAISEQGGKYEFFGEKEGTFVNREDIEEALSKVQGYINNYLVEPDEKTSSLEMNEKLFKSSAAVFSAATGINDDALSLEDDSFKKVKGGLTEENYLERITNDINSIKDRSKRITGIMTEYASKNDLVKEKMSDPFKPLSENDKNPHLSKVLEEYRKFLERNRISN